MKNKPIFLLTFVCLYGTALLSAQEIPLVYAVEHTGAKFAKPILPNFDQLPSIRPLTDPFLMSDGSKRVTNFSDWAHRRAEIHEEIENYEIGQKPGKPQNMTASFTLDTLLSVNITVNGETLTIASKVSIPEGEGPFPAVIGIGRESGSLPSEIFTDRKIATITFDFTQVMAHGQTRGEEPINKLYPELEHMGAYNAWSWGISRLIDGLEMVSDDLNIDLSHIAVTGCSFAGKMALFAGAFDERIALTIVQESGGGGAAAWRVSETLGNVETLGNTSRVWFMEEMFQFANNVPKLPFDHHELMALVAPRALLVLGNPDYEWLADESGYVSCRAAHEVWKSFGVGDRFGFSIVDGHGHCQLPDEQRPEVEAFIDKFLLGDTSANTDVQVHSFESVDHEKWYEWWESGIPTLKEVDLSLMAFNYYELECAPHGSEWNVEHDSGASGDEYITVQKGLNSAESATTTKESTLKLKIDISKDGSYYLYARLNCQNAADDSFYMKIDDGEFETYNGLQTEGWEWVKLDKTNLTAGAHNLTFTYREDGAKIDKICITDYEKGPSDEWDLSSALNACK